MNSKPPLGKSIENLENSFLLWDEDAIAGFVNAALKQWNIKTLRRILKKEEKILYKASVSKKGGDNMHKKGLCARCIHDKDCDYPRKFPVHACDDFTPSKDNNYEETQKWSEKE